MKGWTFRSISASIKVLNDVEGRGLRRKCLSQLLTHEYLLLTEVTRQFKILLTEGDNFTVLEVTFDCWNYIPHCQKRNL